MIDHRERFMDTFKAFEIWGETKAQTLLDAKSAEAERDHIYSNEMKRCFDMPQWKAEHTVVSSEVYQEAELKSIKAFGEAKKAEIKHDQLRIKLDIQRTLCSLDKAQINLI